MKQNQPYRRRLQRRIHLGGAQILLGLGLALYGYTMRLVHPNGTARFQFSWQMFSAMGLVILVCGVQRFYQGRKILNGHVFYQEKSRVEEDDERSQLAERLAWTAAGRICVPLLFAAMMAALAKEQLAVFWSCYITCIVLVFGQLLFKRWYRSRL